MLMNSPAASITKEFQLKNQQGATGTLKLIRHHSEISHEAARSILVRSFISEYKKYLNPADIGEGLTQWEGEGSSVEEYYKKYFATELEEYQKGKIGYWVEAYIGNELVAWATFIKEQSEDNALYMNLLIVAPEHQEKGVGSNLVFAAQDLGIVPELNAINILLRKSNEGGRKFYAGLGFAQNEEYSRPDNFVDMNLLEPLTWTNPALTASKKTSAKFKTG